MDQFLYWHIFYVIFAWFHSIGYFVAFATSFQQTQFLNFTTTNKNRIKAPSKGFLWSRTKKYCNWKDEVEEKIIYQQNLRVVLGREFKVC